MVNLDLYRVFYTVAKCGSLTKAAEELYISQPGLSRYLSRLEDELGVPMFERRKGKIILNTYRFVKEYIDPGAPGGKEHIGYIIDREGFAEFKRWALEGVELLPETEIRECVYWSGIHFDR